MVSVVCKREMNILSLHFCVTSFIFFYVRLSGGDFESFSRKTFQNAIVTKQTSMSILVILGRKTMQDVSRAARWWVMLSMLMGLMDTRLLCYAFHGMQPA